MKSEFTAAEASRLAGFRKPWMLAHLEREQTFVREHVADRRHGRARKYTFGDVVVLRTINRMLELGARPARVRHVIRELGQLEGLKGNRRSMEALVRKLGVCLFVSSSEALLLRDQDEVVDLLQKGQLAFGFMIDFKSTVAPVSAVVKEYRSRRVGNWGRDEATLESICEGAGL